MIYRTWALSSIKSSFELFWALFESWSLEIVHWALKHSLCLAVIISMGTTSMPTLRCSISYMKQICQGSKLCCVAITISYARGLCIFFYQAFCFSSCISCLVMNQYQKCKHMFSFSGPPNQSVCALTALPFAMIVPWNELCSIYAGSGNRLLLPVRSLGIQ